MRLVIRNVRHPHEGAIVNSDIVIDDGIIASIERNYSGPYDEIIDGHNMLLIPGVFEPYAIVNDEEELFNMLSSGITGAIIYIHGNRKEFIRLSSELLRKSPIDVGFRTDSLSVAPWETFGYMLRKDSDLRKLRLAYGGSLVGILGTDSIRCYSFLKNATRYGHKTMLVAPRFLFNKKSTSYVAINIEDVFNKQGLLRRQALDILNLWHRDYAITFGRLYQASASLLLSTILYGYTSRRIFDRMYEALKDLGINYGIRPGARANVVLMRRSRGEILGIKTYFEPSMVLVGGNLVYYDGSIIGKPHVETIKQIQTFKYV